MKAKIRTVFLLCLSTVLIFSLLVSCGSENKIKINLDNYVSINVTGCEGYGTADYSIDLDQIAEDFHNVQLTEHGEEYFPDYTMKEILREYVSGSLDKSSYLSNGDVVTFEWDISNVVESSLNVSIEASSIKYTVKDLPEYETVDVFDFLSVEFAGVSPEGTVSLNVSENNYGITDNSFRMNREEPIENGSSATVEFTEEAIESLINDYQKAPAYTSNDYPIENLPYFATDISQFSDEELAEAYNTDKDKCFEEINAEWASEDDFIDGINIQKRRLDSMDYLGCYFMTNTKTGGNRLFFIYKMIAMQNSVTEYADGSTTNNNLDDPVIYYYFVFYNDLVVEQDGTCDILSNIYKDPESVLGDKAVFKMMYSYKNVGYNTGIHYYSGCQDLDEMKNDILNNSHSYELTYDSVDYDTERIEKETRDAEQAQATEGVEESNPQTEDIVSEP